MAEAIEAKVLEIIDEYHLVVNAGKEDGVSVDNVVYIYGTPKDIYDQDTGKLLQKIISRPKAQLLVVEVYDKVSLCKSITKKMRDFFSSGFPSIGEMHMIREVTKMPIDQEDATGDWPSFKPVKVGDIVHIYIGKD